MLRRPVTACAVFVMFLFRWFVIFFFFNDTATTEIYTLSLHDALPICPEKICADDESEILAPCMVPRAARRDRKSTRLNSSHVSISYAVFCLKKKKKRKKIY